MCPGSGESIYLWMYRQGLSMRPLSEVLAEAVMAGHDVRQKDVRNYWNGWYRHDLYFSGRDATSIIMPSASSGVPSYDSLPDSPYLGMPEITCRYVPCSEENRPLIKWGRGCLSMVDAVSWPGCHYLAENLRGTRLVVIDVDGDHGGGLDVETLRFFAYWRDETCCHDKPDLVLDHVPPECYDLSVKALPTSYHLTFTTTKVIPTMHFTRAHVDVIGNQRNSLRYFKNKSFNGIPPMPMDSETWGRIFDYVEGRQHGNVDG